MALENHLDFTTAAVLMQILAGVDSPFLRITFDTGNAFRLGENPVESASGSALTWPRRTSRTS